MSEPIIGHPRENSSHGTRLQRSRKPGGTTEERPFLGPSQRRSRNLCNSTLRYVDGLCIHNVYRNGMRIIKRSALVTYWKRNPQAQSGLTQWYKLAKAANWTCLQDVRATFPHADAVMVDSGRTTVVFNIAGNKYRLITAIHYNRQQVFTLMVLTHVQYDKDKWKDVL